jgi:RNA polymerase sigma-70 factor (ECF subfamily)
VNRCRDGDREAWAEFVNRFAGSVYAVARRAFGLGAHDVEDVFQETFARTYQYLGKVREPEAVGVYVKQVTRRLCIDRLAAQSHVSLPGDDESEAMPARDEAIDRLDEALSIQQALADLPAPCREVIERFFWRDETYRTISEALDIPFGTIGSRIARGLARVRSQLEE